MRLSYDNRIFLLALATGAAPATLALVLLWLMPWSSQARWGLVLAVVVCWILLAATVRSSVVRPLRTIANMQAAVREGDFSIRARSSGVNDSLSGLMHEINELSATLQDERRGAFEAGALMRKVLSEIDVAVFAFDDQERLRLLNRAAERLIGKVTERAMGRSAEALGIRDILQGDDAQTIERTFPGGTGRWGIRRTFFRQAGAPLHLVVVADLSRALREEERQAWQRLVRVLGHELNNSLAPIKSISQSLQSLFHREIRPSDWEDDVSRGLKVIADRSEALTRFMQDYSRLARLPKPNLQRVEIAPLLRRVAHLEARLPVKLEEGPEIVLQADPDQLEQLFINLIRNAVDATLPTGGEVKVGWDADDSILRVRVDDQGPGIANAANLFVPFFTTKPGGSGIGLALSRQIAEGHGGQVSLQNRTDGPGCEALVVLPASTTDQ